MIVRFIQIRNKKIGIVMTAPAIFVEFLLMVYVLQIKINGNCQEVFLSIDKYSGCVQNLSGEWFLWGFSLDKVSNFIGKETLRILFWAIFEMFWRSCLKKASSQFPILITIVFVTIKTHCTKNEEILNGKLLFLCSDKS